LITKTDWVSLADIEIIKDRVDRSSLILLRIGKISVDSGKN
jgi:hypothetical protein